MALAAGTRLSTPIVAQGVLAQLGLTEASARNFLFSEMKAQYEPNRRNQPYLTGHRAFYTLPPAARGPAATALFAWAKAYVNSPALKSAYAQFRKEANPLDERPGRSVESRLAEMKAAREMARGIAQSLPPAERDKMLAMLKEQDAQVAEMTKAFEAEQAARKAQNAVSVARFEAQYPADPNRIVARRLRAFLDETADADFSAPIIRLTGGPDGMEFITPAHQVKPVAWQLAVLAGPEATKAARAAADAWLKEITP
jgi:hypothetical protein